MTNIQKSFWGQVLGWLIMAKICCIVIWGCLRLYPRINPADPTALGESIVLRLPLMAAGLVFITGGIILINLVTPNDWFEKIYESPVAIAVVLAAFILALAWMAGYA